MNAKPASRHSVMTEGHRPRPTVGEDNGVLPTFASLFPFLPHRGNGFSDLCLPITVRFTQHQPSDGITHQHASDIMNAPALPPSPDAHHIHW